MQKHGSKPWLQHFVCTETSPHSAHPTKTVCTQRERDNSWSIATYNKIIIIIAWLWVSLLVPVLCICYSWNMSECPELTLLQTALKTSSFSSTSEQLLCFLYKTLLTILLQQFISGYTERWAAGSRLAAALSPAILQQLMLKPSRPPHTVAMRWHSLSQFPQHFILPFSSLCWWRYFLDCYFEFNT